MSFQIIDNCIYDRVAFLMHRASVNLVINDFYFPCCKGMSAHDIDVIVNFWLGLNILSYNVAHGDDEKHSWRSLRNCRGTTHISSVQFVKWLQCIRVNISIREIETAGIPVSSDLKKNVDFLDTLINEALAAIVQTMPEYKAASWADLPDVYSGQSSPVLADFNFSSN